MYWRGVCLLAVLVGPSLGCDEASPRVRYCGEHGFNRPDDLGQVWFFPPEPVPVDAHPWLFVDCKEELHDCALVAEDHVVAVDIDRMNDCEASMCDVVEFAPREPLRPATQYALRCDGRVGLETVVTRAEETVASPPAEVMVTRAHVDEGLELGFEAYGLAAPFLREGGRIELAYPDGGVLPITSSFTGYALPASSGPLVLTPVAADGERGEAVTVEPTGAGGCTIAPERSTGWWLLVGLWVARRRRVRATP